MPSPIVGPSYNLDSRPASVQRTINMMPVPLEPGNERTDWVLKDVPGLREFSESESLGPPQNILLMNWDETTPTFPGPDQSPFNRAFTSSVTGSITRQTSIPKFGASNLQISAGSPAQSPWIRTPNGAGFDILANQSFTIQLWFRTPSAETTLVAYDSIPWSGGPKIALRTTFSNTIQVWFGGSVAFTTSATFTPSGSDWQFVSLSRVAGTLYCGVNGVVQSLGGFGGAITAPFTLIGSVDNSVMGDNGTTNIDNLRIRLNEALYTSAYTNPVLPAS